MRSSVEETGALPLVVLRHGLEELLGERVDLTTPAPLRPEAAENVLAEALPLQPLAGNDGGTWHSGHDVLEAVLNGGDEAGPGHLEGKAPPSGV